MDPEAVVRRYFETVHANVSAVPDLYTTDAVLHYVGRHRLGGEHRGRDGIRALFEQSRLAFRGTQRLQVHDVLANGTHAVALLRASAARDGASSEWHRVVVFHLAGDLIREQWIHDSDQHLIEEVLA